ncbi:MAG: polyphosphate kinase 1 [Planctomycetota bacterium]|nr:polyphosphate kinase 1 [Planctomycetota bacterium]
MESKSPAESHSAPASPAEPVPGEFLNRELSWLEFNRRVLHEALDERTPLLERVNFLAIFSSNLDEFVQKRVGGLKRQIAAGIMTRTPDGMSPQEQLAAIRRVIVEMLDTQAKCFTESIRPALAAQGVHLLRWEEATDAECEVASAYFRTNLFPVLTPLAVDPGHPFPFISNLSTSLGVMLRPPGEPGSAGGAEGASQFARVKVPKVVPRWIDLARINLPAGKPPASPNVWRLMHVEQIIRHNLQDLFEGMVIEEVEPFRVTRSADVERDQEDAEDLLEMIEKELRERRFAQTIRLEVDNDPSKRITPFLMGELELDETDVYRMPAEMDYTDLFCISALDIPHLRAAPWTPVAPPRLRDEEADIFSIIRAGDVLVHHPYESFSASVERFIRAAAADPKVIAIKLTLYRTSKDSPFIPELIRAAESGKQVVALVELSARFDEERNILLAQTLEKAGVHVVYGIVGLKTHTKTSLVVRHEPEGMKAYAHIGTGNYNSKTAQLYTDLGLFTCDPDITADLVELFHYLTGRSQKKEFRKLLIAPINMKRRFVELIDRQIAYAQAWRERGGDPADPNRPRIIAKMNSLEDRGVCRRLYDASRAGVAIQLIVRGFCCLRPGVPGMSENITVQSVIGRFLEHSRIFYFHNAGGGTGEYYIGSADWMHRNLNDRVECITPITEPALQERLRQVLEIMLGDQRQAWEMRPDGSYVQRRPDAAGPEAAAGTHARLMELARHEAARDVKE